MFDTFCWRHSLQALIRASVAMFKFHKASAIEIDGEIKTQVETYDSEMIKCSGGQDTEGE